MNKKGQTFHFWIEAIIFVALFLVIVAIIGADMNQRYQKNYDATLGLNLTSSVTSLQSFQTSLVNSTTQGQASVTDFGVLKLLTTPAILLQALGIIWQFASGSFIYSLVMAMNLGVFGTYVAVFFQMLYVIIIGFILLKLVLRVNI